MALAQAPGQRRPALAISAVSRILVLVNTFSMIRRPAAIQYETRTRCPPQ